LPVEKGKKERVPSPSGKKSEKKKGRAGVLHLSLYIRKKGAIERSCNQGGKKSRPGGEGNKGENTFGRVKKKGTGAKSQIFC